MIQYLSTKAVNHYIATKEATKSGCQVEMAAKHDNAVTTLNRLISTALVLRYFDCTKQISSGLGYAVLHKGQPIAFGARELTPTEKKICSIINH